MHFSLYPRFTGSRNPQISSERGDVGISQPSEYTPFTSYFKKERLMVMSLFYVFCLWTGAILLTILLDSELQKQCTIYWSRAKEKPLWLRCWHMSFFISVMLPTRVFCLQPWIMDVAAPGTFFAVFALGNPIVAISFFLWVGLILENIMLGILYHNSVLGKRYLDTVGLGSDMIFFFLGNTGSIPVALSKRVFKGSVVASGGVMAEKAFIDVYTYGETCIERNEHVGEEKYDFNKNWNMKKNSSYEKAPFQNLVAYMKGK